jgi:hypothetical protein
MNRSLRNLCLHLLASLALALPSFDLSAQPASVEAEWPDDSVQDDLDATAQARQAAKQDRDDQADRQLTRPRKGGAAAADSAVIARRAVMLCSRLRNEDEAARAQKVAQRTVRLLARLGEANNEDRVERLYWEACLEGDFLHHRGRALRLPQRQLKPRTDDN